MRLGLPKANRNGSFAVIVEPAVLEVTIGQLVTFVERGIIDVEGTFATEE